MLSLQLRSKSMPIILLKLIFFFKYPLLETLHMYSSHWLQGIGYKFRSCEFWTFNEWNREHICLLLFNWNDEKGKAKFVWNEPTCFLFLQSIATLLSLEEINTKTFCWVFQFSFQSCSYWFLDIYVLKIMLGFFMIVMYLIVSLSSRDFLLL